MQILREKSLFNVDGDDSVLSRFLINGNPTNLMNLNNVKYPWGVNLYKRMRNNHWLPDLVQTGEDITDFNNLTSFERNCFYKILSFLVFLDSLQSQNLFRIANFVTAPEIVAALTKQAEQEVLHSDSYQYLIESIIPVEDRNRIYDLWREYKPLKERNEYIASFYNDFHDNPCMKTFGNVLVANYILESIYFWIGFLYFFLLASQHKMTKTKDMFSYISRDERLHIIIFQNFINDLRKEHPECFENKKVYEMMEEAVRQEIQWNNSIFENKILGLTPEGNDQYVKYLANTRLQSIGLSPLFENKKYNINPYTHLEQVGNTGAGTVVKSNFFETRPSSYSQTSVLQDWKEW